MPIVVFVLEMEQQTLRKLLAKVKTGTATPAEEASVKAWLHQLNEDTPTQLSDNDLMEGRQTMWQVISTATQPKVKRLWPRWAAAAAVVLLTAAAGYYVSEQNKPMAVAKQDLQPGTNGAVLTLANGQKLVLEKTRNGAISTGINKTNDSLLVYNDANAVGYNTLETPRGRQYSVVLPDGSKVWLNAASSLKYPTHFVGKERLVELTGEAYFEVIHNDKIPFRVKTGKQLTEDIGTSFNISAYPDEELTTTTLVEGAVKVNNKLLEPGFSAESETAALTTVKKADVDQIISWKNGAFSFNKTDLKTVMRQIARWYDVDVEYEGNVPTQTITGEVHRNVNALQALQILTYLDIHYRIQGKKIIITQ